MREPEPRPLRHITKKKLQTMKAKLRLANAVLAEEEDYGPGCPTLLGRAVHLHVDRYRQDVRELAGDE